MSSDPHTVRQIFERLLELSADQHHIALDAACAGDPSLRQRVGRLLEAHLTAGSLFDTDVTDPTGSLDQECATLAAGTMLGPYRITGLIGHGGMGQVYHAVDTRLDRPVAVKVLLAGSQFNPTARQRFEAEARTAAALAHSHICRLLDIGRQNGFDFLVMEHLEGETLAARLRQHRLSLAESLACAIQIAESLAAAHRAGIIHRDLKPGNIMVTADGPKLLDFGLAKRRQKTVLQGAGTLDEPLTCGGMLLGTVQYMAPEQLEGRPADERSDIFAFGAVLYEMLTGQQAFIGSNDASLIASIVHVDPPVPSAIEPTCPRELDSLVSRCLAKNPAARYQSMADVHRDLLAIRTGRLPSRRPFAIPRANATVTAASSMLVLVVVLGMILWRNHSLTEAAATAGSITRNLTRLTFDSGLQTDPTFSPDRRFIAYASDLGGNFDIWVKPVAGGNAVRVTTSPAADTQPSWSPDGKTLVFRSERDGGGLFLVPALGGPERRLTDRGVYPSWSADGQEVSFLSGSFANLQARLHTIEADGGTSREVQPEFSRSGMWVWIAPHPDGRTSFLGWHDTLGVGFFTVSEDGEAIVSKLPAGDELLPVLAAGASHRLWNLGDVRFQWNSEGTALLLQSPTLGGVKNLWRVRIDPQTLEWASTERLTTGATTDVSASLASDGTQIVFSSQQLSVRLWRFPLGDGQIRESDGRPVTEEGSGALHHSLSPDGRSMVFSIARAGASDSSSLWVMDLNSGRSDLLTTSGSDPTWAPDGQQVVYTKSSLGARTGAISSAVAIQTLGGPERLITPWLPKMMAGEDWMGDGLLVCAGGIEVWPIGEAPAVRPVRTVLAIEGGVLWNARVSPNGRWLTFSIFRPAQPNISEVGITSADGPPNRAWHRVAGDMPWVDKPRWGADGRRLYFVANNGSFLNLWAVDIDPRLGTSVREPFQITQFDSPAFRISPAVAATNMNIEQGNAFLTIQTASGNIWLLDGVER